MFFKRIRIGGYYIFDQNNDLNLKEYYPVKVRVASKAKHGNYVCYPIEPMVYPCKADGYASRVIVVHKKYLTPTTIDERIVIRSPINMPRFSKRDYDDIINAADLIRNLGNFKFADKLSATANKIMYYLELEKSYRKE